MSITHHNLINDWAKCTDDTTPALIALALLYTLTN